MITQFLLYTCSVYSNLHGIKHCPLPAPLTGVTYLATVVVFSAVDLRLLNLPELAVENYSFAICICSVVAAFLSGGFTLQSLRWQLSKFDKRVLLNQLKGT